MFGSLKKIFASNELSNEDTIIGNDIDILAGLMIEAANTDGNITDDEVIKISKSLINVFKEEPNLVEEVHYDYIMAGAKVITLNNYSCTPERLERDGSLDMFEKLQEKLQEKLMMNSANPRCGRKKS